MAESLTIIFVRRGFRRHQVTLDPVFIQPLYRFDIHDVKLTSALPAREKQAGRFQYLQVQHHGAPVEFGQMITEFSGGAGTSPN